MAVKIRLQKFGSKHNSFFRIVAAESTRSRDGKFLALIGTYNAVDGSLKVDTEIANHWYRNGALPTDTVKSLFKKNKIFLTKIPTVKKEPVKKDIKKVVKKETTKKEPVKKVEAASKEKAANKDVKEKPVAKKATQPKK